MKSRIFHIGSDHIKLFFSRFRHPYANTRLSSLVKSGIKWFEKF